MKTFKDTPFSVDGNTHLQIKPFRMKEELNMDFLKALFESGALTWEQFVEAVNQNGYKLADLATGNYVAKKKFDDELAAKDTAIETLKGQLSTRDTDIKTLKTQLADAGTDATKLADVTAQLEKLQGDYNTAKKEYQAALDKQNYEFAVKEFASAQKFTSSAAKREFINEMVKENLKMKDNTIIGADDFMKVYKEANSDSFVVEPDPETPPEGGAGQPPKPSFGQPTPPTPPAGDNPFDGMFHFAGVRPHE